MLKLDIDRLHILLNNILNTPVHSIKQSRTGLLLPEIKNKAKRMKEKGEERREISRIGTSLSRSKMTVLTLMQAMIFLQSTMTSRQLMMNFGMMIHIEDILEDQEDHMIILQEVSQIEVHKFDQIPCLAQGHQPRDLRFDRSQDPQLDQSLVAQLGQLLDLPQQDSQAETFTDNYFNAKFCLRKESNSPHPLLLCFCLFGHCCPLTEKTRRLGFEWRSRFFLSFILSFHHHVFLHLRSCFLSIVVVQRLERLAA